MRALFALLVLCLLTVAQNYYDERQQVLVKDPIIFGLDLLGWGVDLRLGKPEEAIKVPIFKWTYADANKYLYPLEPQTTFTVPDEVYVRTVAEITATNKYFETGQSYVDFLLLRLGVAIEKTSNSSSGSSGGNSTGKVNLAAFSGDVGVTYQTTTLNDNKHVLIVNTLESGLWQLVIGPSLVPRDRVLGIINDTTVTGTEEAFATFINRHGTHFIESVIVGGNLEMSSSIRTSSQITNDEISVAANFQFQNAFGLDSGRANIGLNITNTQTYFEKESNNWMKSLGGDPELANFFSGTLRPNETFTLWQETLISNPAVIRFRLREISWLFDSTTRPLVSTVVKKYLNGTLPAFY